MTPDLHHRLSSAGGYFNNTGSVSGLGYIASIRATTRNRNWCTYIGSNENTGIEALELANEKLFAVGYTNDPNLPIVQISGMYAQPALIGVDTWFPGINGKEGLILGFEPSTALAYSTFYGGDQGGFGESVRSASIFPGELFIAGITSKNFPIAQSFPLYDPGAPAYYDEVYDEAFTNSADMFVGTLCTEAFTGPVGLAEGDVVNTGFTALPLGGGRWQLGGMQHGKNSVSIFNSAGQNVCVEQVIMAPNATYLLDLSRLAAGTYTIQAAGEESVAAQKIVLTH